MWSKLGLVACNATLIHRPNEPPVKVDLQAVTGMAIALINIEYSTHTHSNLPQFDLSVHSRFSRADAWIIDRQGSDSLLANPSSPTILPIINLNLTSSFAIAQALIPGIYHGSIDLRSSHASIVMDDLAREVPGRTLDWEEMELGVKKGLVRWDGMDQEVKGGSVSVSTGYAAVRLLMLGLEGTGIGVWPDSADNLILGW
ncbi:hypothetical protein BDV93DRAFT_51392 [Ceratobasidium sp. AG-I]|nr:hypothetical protein BDV93DRAFT_51392 [Ceratobasidium sp. AG-I]